MFQFTGNFFTKNGPLKVLSFILALLIWFYIVNELNRGSQEELQALRKIMQGKHTFEQSGNGKIRR
jgi:predicted membrane protein